MLLVEDPTSLMNNISAAAPGVELQLELPEGSWFQLDQQLLVSGGRNVTIFGRGSTLSGAAGNGSNGFSWTQSHRAIEVTSGASLTLHDLTVSDFKAPMGGCVLISSSMESASTSSLTLVSSRLRRCTASVGGAVAINGGRLALWDGSEISDCLALQGTMGDFGQVHAGGVLLLAGEVDIRDSSIFNVHARAIRCGRSSACPACPS